MLHTGKVINVVYVYMYDTGILIPHSSVTELHNVLTKVAEQATGNTNE